MLCFAAIVDNFEKLDYLVLEVSYLDVLCIDLLLYAVDHAVEGLFIFDKLFL